MKTVKEASFCELLAELRSRDEYVASVIWVTDDLKRALEEDIPATEENISILYNNLSNGLDDCSYGWEHISNAIENCRDKFHRQEEKL